MQIAPLKPADYDEWLVLWSGNNQGEIASAITAQTWSRIADPQSSVKGFAARIDGKMAGLVHYILHPVTGALTPACYMQDVYTMPEFRKRGVAKALVKHLAAEGKKSGWSRLYWLVESKNEAAQALYKTLGFKLNFDLFVLPFTP